MHRSTVRRTLTLSAAAALALVVMALPSDLPAQAIRGKLGVAQHESTTEGDWFGTWVYGTRQAKTALWIRAGEDGLPEVKIKMRAMKYDEIFETDWTTAAEYQAPDGSQGTFRIRWDERDGNEMSGSWSWDVQSERRGRTEVAKITFFRTGYGRKAVIRFTELERTLRIGDQSRTSRLEQTWTFHKVAKRLALWEELPI